MILTANEEPTMNDTLEITTLGGLEVRVGGEPVTGFYSRKVDALLVYLACTGRPQPRDVLADLLWDEVTQSRAVRAAPPSATTPGPHRTTPASARSMRPSLE